MRFLNKKGIFAISSKESINMLQLIIFSQYRTDVFDGK